MSDVAETQILFCPPLQGECLIEASAGTGNLHDCSTICACYLAPGGSAAFPARLTVEELLVVTLTEAATAELQSGRIRSNY